MSSLEERLKNLKESKKSLERKVRKLHLNSKRLTKENKVEKDSKKINKFLVGYVKENLTKEHLSEIPNDYDLFCPKTGQTMSTKACMARTFLEGHPRHKVCEKCTLLYGKASELMQIIDKDK